MADKLPELQYDAPDWAKDRPTKRAITFHARQARLYLSGAMQLLHEDPDDEVTAVVALDLAEEAANEARYLLAHRLAGTKP